MQHTHGRWMACLTSLKRSSESQKNSTWPLASWAARLRTAPTFKFVCNAMSFHLESWCIISPTSSSSFQMGLVCWLCICWRGWSYTGFSTPFLFLSSIKELTLDTVLSGEASSTMITSPLIFLFVTHMCVLLGGWYIRLMIICFLWLTLCIGLPVCLEDGACWSTQCSFQCWAGSPQCAPRCWSLERSQRRSPAVQMVSTRWGVVWACWRPPLLWLVECLFEGVCSDEDELQFWRHAHAFAGVVVVVAVVAESVRSDPSLSSRDLQRWSLGPWWRDWAYRPAPSATSIT